MSRAVHAELRQIGLSNDDRARGAQPRNVYRVLRCDRRILQQQGPLGRREADAVLDILDADGHTGQLARIVTASNSRVDAIRLAISRISIEHDEGVELGILPGDDIQTVFEHIACRLLAGPDGLRDINQ